VRRTTPLNITDYYSCEIDNKMLYSRYSDLGYPIVEMEYLQSRFQKTALSHTLQSADFICRHQLNTAIYLYLYASYKLSKIVNKMTANIKIIYK